MASKCVSMDQSALQMNFVIYILKLNFTQLKQLSKILVTASVTFFRNNVTLNQYEHEISMDTKYEQNRFIQTKC